MEFKVEQKIKKRNDNNPKYMDEIFLMENSTIAYFNCFDTEKQYVFDTATGDIITDEETKKSILTAIKKYLFS